ncbi:MAG: hypothetical protein ACYTF0_02330 [Planctomycetota bacterium]
MRIAYVLMVCGLVATLGAAEGKTGVINGNMSEVDPESGMPVGWKIGGVWAEGDRVEDQQDYAELAADDDVYASKPTSLHMTSNSDLGRANASIRIDGDFSSLTISGKLRYSAGSHAVVRVSYSKGSGKDFETIAGEFVIRGDKLGEPDTWHSFEKTLKNEPPADADRARVMLSLMAAGEAWLDDLRVTR